MKVVLFCGGFGTRLREFSHTIPKPLVPIGQRPIIWHLMRYYAHHGHKDFVLCLGYRGDLIKEFFLEYNECLSNDFTLSGGGAEIDLHASDIHDWRITFVDTGIQSNIAERMKAVRSKIGDDTMFMANYSDGVTDLPLGPYLDRFEQSDAVGCFLSVRPSHSLSGVDVDDEGFVRGIDYLSRTVWINAGFFVFRTSIFDYIEDGEELVERPFERLIAARKLMSYKYDGFWAAMDTFKDKKQFDDMYDSGRTPWTVWKRPGRD